ncbi:MAG: hypothetical protein EBZ07_08425, partial [Verrucomicrobia bacterium]|nr:hypothetical protein [Verrucomicrobiota bacterium]
ATIIFNYHYIHWLFTIKNCLQFGGVGDGLRLGLGNQFNQVHILIWLSTTKQIPTINGESTKTAITTPLGSDWIILPRQLGIGDCKLFTIF